MAYSVCFITSGFKLHNILYLWYFIDIWGSRRPMRAGLGSYTSWSIKWMVERSFSYQKTMVYPIWPHYKPFKPCYTWYSWYFIDMCGSLKTHDVKIKVICTSLILKWMIKMISLGKKHIISHLFHYKWV